MVLRGVIQRKVEANAHAVLVALGRQCRKVLHGAELRLHRAEVRNRIAAVGPPLRAGEQRHQVNVGRTRLLQVREMLPHPAKRTTEAICIQHHAKDFIALAPVRICLPLAVQFFHRFRSGLIHPIEHREKVLKGIFVIVIQFRVQPLQFIQPFAKARSKFLCLPLCFSHKNALSFFLNIIMSFRNSSNKMHSQILRRLTKLFRFVYTLLATLERCRSGHNEAVLKTVSPTGHMGSNPILSAKREARK